MTDWIYFDKNGEACAFVIGDPVAVVNREIWKEYCKYAKGTYWDIVDGEFVQIKPIDWIRSRATALNTIATLKQNLSKTDYKSIKHMEGAMSDEEWAPVAQQRADWREVINALQETYEID